MKEYQVILSYGECHIAPFVDKSSFDAIVEAVKRRGYEVQTGKPEEGTADYIEVYALKDGKKAFTIGYERG